MAKAHVIRELQGNENDAIDEHEQELTRAEESKQGLDARIDGYLALYNAVVAKVDGEHAQAAIFAAIIAEK